MVNQIKVPSQIEEMIAGKSYTLDTLGMSGSQILILDDMVLKIEDSTEETDRQVNIMRWMDGKVPVPKILAYVTEDGKSYLLMSRLEGKMSCDQFYLENEDILLEGLVSGLKTLWKTDVTGCPCVRDLDVVLQEARTNVENNLVDVDNVEPTTFGEGGFRDPAHLLAWLEANRPTFEPVLSHGDYCLPNIFLENGALKGFIDLGRAGIGDKWNDIALCYRSLKHNFDGSYGGEVRKDFNPDMLFEKLGIEPDWKKIEYYLLLDELF